MELIQAPNEPGARGRILAAAARLFYRQGIRSTGIDQVIAEAAVAKASLYAHFGSKDALVTAWLEQRDRAWFAWFDRAVLEVASEPLPRLLGVFDVLGRWFGSEGFRGCAFINSALELNQPGHPSLPIVARHAAQLESRLTALAREAGLPEPERVGRQLFLLVEGAVVCAAIGRGPEAAVEARAAAARLLGVA